MLYLTSTECISYIKSFLHTWKLPTQRFTHTVMVPWPHCDGTLATLWWCPGHTVMVPWPHCDGVLATLWWCPGHTVMVPWPHCDGVLATLWWYPGHIVMVPWPHCDGVLDCFRLIFSENTSYSLAVRSEAFKVGHLPYCHAEITWANVFFDCPQ